MIRITDTPFSLRRRSSNRMIPACTVTSSAVVGSSATMIFGSQVSAIAIEIRWRIPPENWCGYRPSVPAGSGSAPDPRRSTARDSASRLESPRFRRVCSVSCVPIDSIG